MKTTRFSAQQVGSLRRYHEIPRFVPSQESPGGELLPISQAAKTRGVAASTLHRWLNAGLVAGEQLTPGAPWRIRITEQLRNLFVDHAPPDYVSVMEAKGLPQNNIYYLKHSDRVPVRGRSE